MSKKLNTEEFIKLSQDKHGDKFCYKHTFYSGMRKKLKVTCNKHGDFETIAETHVRGICGGCNQCARESQALASSIRMKNKSRRGEDISTIIKYNHITGEMFWIKNTTVRNVIGMRVGNKAKNGYMECSISGKRYHLHRLAWLLYYGSFPDEQIDHINMDRSDNRIANLRQASACENQQNRTKQSNNTSGVKGVCWDKNSNRWKARVYAQRKLVAAKTFHNIADAKRWVENERTGHHKQYRRD